MFGGAGEEEKEAKKIAPWWRYAEDFFRSVHATDLVRIAPATPWHLDTAFHSVCTGPDFEAGEDKIGIPIPGLTYQRRGEQPSTSAATSPSKAGEKKPLVGTIPAVPAEPFVAPVLQEHELGIELVQNLEPEHIAMLVRVLVSLSGDKGEKLREISKFVGIAIGALKNWLSKHEKSSSGSKKGKLSQVKSETSDETLNGLRVWLRHASASRVNEFQNCRREAATKAKKKLDKSLIFPDECPADMAVSYGLVNTPSNLTALTEQGLGGPPTDGLPSSTGTTVVLGAEPAGANVEELDGESENLDIKEKAERECTTAFGMNADLRHFDRGSAEETMPLHTTMLLERSFKLNNNLSSKSSSSDGEPCAVCAKLKTLAKKCGTEAGSVNCLKKKEEDVGLPGVPKSLSVKSTSDKSKKSTKEELKRLENAFKENPYLLASAPSNELDGEIFALQYELLWHLQLNKQRVKRAQQTIGKGLDADNDEQGARKAKLDEANSYMSVIREIKRQQKKEKREADQLAALEKAKAAVGDGRREPKPKREIGSAAIVPDPKTEIPVYKPPSASAVIKAIESAPARVKKIFGLTNYDGSSGHLKSFSLSGTPRSGSPVLGGSPIRSPMSQILLDPFHSVSDNSACCVCAGTTESLKMKQTIKCSQCEVIVHPACYGITGKVGSNWLCWVCTDVAAAGRAIPRTEKKSSITLQDKMALYRGVECILCPVKLGAFKKTVDGKGWCHVTCARWVPEASLLDKNVANVVKPVSIESVPRERRNASCNHCTRSNGTLMRCSFGHCQIVFHPLCCRRAACHMRAIDSEKRSYTAFCEKHTQSERDKDVAANLIGDPVPALVELYNQSPLERQLSGSLQRTLSGGSPKSPMSDALRRMLGGSQKHGNSDLLPSSTKSKPKKVRTNLRQSSKLSNVTATSSSLLTGFDSEENFGELPSVARNAT